MQQRSRRRRKCSRRQQVPGCVLACNTDACGLFLRHAYSPLVSGILLSTAATSYSILEGFSRCIWTCLPMRICFGDTSKSENFVSRLCTAVCTSLVSRCVQDAVVDVSRCAGRLQREEHTITAHTTELQETAACVLGRPPTSVCAPRQAPPFLYVEVDVDTACRW